MGYPGNVYGHYYFDQKHIKEFLTLQMNSGAVIKITLLNYQKYIAGVDSTAEFIAKIPWTDRKGKWIEPIKN